MTHDPDPPFTAEGGAFPPTGDAADEPANPPEPTTGEIAALFEGFAEALLSPDYCSQMLRKQANLLDQMLYKMMERGMEATEERGVAAASWLPLALKIQKQCIDTAKAAGALEYMKATTPHPLPPIPGDRTDKET